MEKINSMYDKCCTITCDINEHLPTLKRYAEQCKHIIEMGVRRVFSTWAFLSGCPERMISYDYKNPIEFGGNLGEAYEAVKGTGINFTFNQADTRRIQIEQTDLLFIDTEHNYDQLRIELELHANKVNKYILFHDTELFGRVGMDGKNKGLMDAIEEFIEKNKQWVIKERFYNNNGLLVLEKINI